MISIDKQIDLIEHYMERTKEKSIKIEYKDKAKAKGLMGQNQILQAVRTTLYTVRDPPTLELIKKVSELTDTKKAVLNMFAKNRALSEELNKAKVHINKLLNKLNRMEEAHAPKESNPEA